MHPSMYVWLVEAKMERTKEKRGFLDFFSLFASLLGSFAYARFRYSYQE